MWSTEKSETFRFGGSASFPKTCLCVRFTVIYSGDWLDASGVQVAGEPTSRLLKNNQTHAFASAVLDEFLISSVVSPAQCAALHSPPVKYSLLFLSLSLSSLVYEMDLEHFFHLDSVTVSLLVADNSSELEALPSLPKVTLICLFANSVQRPVSR